MGELLRIIVGVIIGNWIYFWMTYKVKEMIESVHYRDEDLWDDYF